jgi:hypothetical protein
MAIDLHTAGLSGLHLSLLLTEDRIDEALDNHNRRAFMAWCKRRKSLCTRIQRALLSVLTT